MTTATMIGGSNTTSFMEKTQVYSVVSVKVK